MATNLWSDDGFVVLNMTPPAATLISNPFTTNITAAGSDHAGATPLVSSTNIVTTTAANTGVRLPAAPVPGAVVRVVNMGANTLNVYPPTGGQVNSLGANVVDTAAVPALAGQTPGQQVYVQDGTTTGSAPNYIRIW